MAYVYQHYNLDIFWLKDESLEDTEDLPEPEDLAADALMHLENCNGRIARNSKASGKRGKRVRNPFL